ncbi:hypothetical protein M2138_001174 [Dysgonomonadaceae bacterium PH5-43]|nr:hypothetical protein [Dysgonomonadaceae bacterium PH5-43]
MQKKLLFRTMLVMLCLLPLINVSAQEEEPLIINVETAGTLSTLIDETSKFEIPDLLLTGNLNGTDIIFIREMAGRDVNGNETEGILTSLNLLFVNIVEGGDGYFDDGIAMPLYTKNDTIGDYMFNKTILTSVTLPNTVKSIGTSAFGNCSDLTDITLGDSIAYIGKDAFEYCSSLVSVNIPKSVEEIDMPAFMQCPNIKEFIVSDENENYSSIDGVLFDKDGKKLFTYPSAKANTYSVPNGVTSIEQGAFMACAGLTNLTISDSVTDIAYGAFAMSGLTKITFGTNVKNIGMAILMGSMALTEINSKSTTPPVVSDNGFYGINAPACTLYVPTGSKTAYSTAAGWSEFTNIIEKDFTSINNINNNNVSIQSISNGIAIETTEATNISVFNITGLKVYQSVVNGYEEVTLDKGVYIVNANNNSKTVIVK